MGAKALIHEFSPLPPPGQCYGTHGTKYPWMILYEITALARHREIR